MFLRWHHGYFQDDIYIYIYTRGTPKNELTFYDGMANKVYNVLFFDIFGDQRVKHLCADHLSREPWLKWKTLTEKKGKNKEL